LQLNNNQIVEISEVCENKIIKIKKIILRACKIDMMRTQRKLGGLNRVVQVDETAVCRGRLITNPSTLIDEITGTTWMIGIIEESPLNRDFLIQIVPNRRISTISNFFNDNINHGTIIKSNEYPSYPSACQENNLDHVIVNHNEGFINEFGDHTNIIENLWSHFKTEMRTRHGIMRNHMEDFVLEFSWKRKNLKNKTHAEYVLAFMKILTIFAEEE
jgi:hypothetical protein